MPKVFTFLNEKVLLKELVLKELLLRREPLPSPTQDCDISVFCRRLNGSCFNVENSEDIGYSKVYE